MTAMKKVILGVVFKANRAARIATVPNRFDLLCGKDTVEKLESMDQVIWVAAYSRPQSWKVNQCKGSGRPFMNLSAFLKKIVLGSGSAYVVTIVARDSMLLEMKMNSGCRRQRDFIAYRYWMVPLVVASFGVGVDVQLGGKREILILFLVILVGKNMSE
jgi:hypothetical protein